MHVNCFSVLLAFAAPSNGQAGQAQNPLGMLIPLALMGVIFYFLLFRPQQQRAKQQAKMLSTLKSGDEVVTSSGIVGTVVTVKEKTITIRSADAKFEVTKGSISEVTPKESAAAAS